MCLLYLWQIFAACANSPTINVYKVSLLDNNTIFCLKLLPAVATLTDLRKRHLFDLHFWRTDYCYCTFKVALLVPLPLQSFSNRCTLLLSRPLSTFVRICLRFRASNPTPNRNVAELFPGLFGLDGCQRSTACNMLEHGDLVSPKKIASSPAERRACRCFCDAAQKRWISQTKHVCCEARRRATGSGFPQSSRSELSSSP